MGFKSFPIIAAVIAASCLSVQQAALADGMRGPSAKKHVVRTSGYRYYRGPWPGGPDPYSYSYRRPAYYGYYNSAYWVPRYQMRYRSRYPFRIPEYRSTWGYPLSCKLRGHHRCGVPYRPRAGRARHWSPR